MSQSAIFLVVAELASITANFLVLAIRGALRLLLVAAIITQLALVLGYLGAIAGGSGVIASPTVAIERLLVLGELPLVVADFARLAAGFRLRLALIFAVVVKGGLIATDLAGLGDGGRPLRVRASGDRTDSDA